MREQNINFGRLKIFHRLAHIGASGDRVIEPVNENQRSSRLDFDCFIAQQPDAGAFKRLDEFLYRLGRARLSLPRRIMKRQVEKTIIVIIVVP